MFDPSWVLPHAAISLTLGDFDNLALSIDPITFFRSDRVVDGKCCEMIVHTPMRFLLACPYSIKVPPSFDEDFIRAYQK